MFVIPHLDIFKRHQRKIIFGALVFWLLLGCLVYLTEIIASTYFGALAMDDIEQKQYVLRWIIWLFLTPIIFILALKINIGNTKLFWFIAIHLLLGTVILGIEFGIEWVILKPLAESFYQRQVLLDELIVPFLNKYFGYVINYFLIVGMVNMYVYMQSLFATKQSLLQTEVQNNELKYQLALAQIQTLKMQIQPHFLFNTHQSILGLILQQDNEKAALMLSKLSELLRSTIEHQQSEFVSVYEEVNTIDLYMDLQKVRYDERLCFIKSISTEASSAFIPFFILQPLLENAIKYSVEQTDEQVTIELKGNVIEQKLRIQIINSHTTPLPIQHQGMGIGMKNIASRLEQYYKQEAFLQMTTEAQHTIVTLSIPLYAK